MSLLSAAPFSAEPRNLFFLPVALIGLYPCGVPADQMVLRVGVNKNWKDAEH